MNTGSSRRRPKRRLFWRIYAFGLALLVAASLSTGVLSYHFAPAVSVPARAADEAVSVLRQTPLEHAEGQLALLHQLTGLDLAIYDAQGALVAAAGTPPSPARPFVEKTRVREGNRWLWSMPIERAEGRYWLLLSTRAGFLPIRILLGLGLVLLLAALLMWPLARGLARPLEHMGETARRLGAGELTARTGLKRADEIGVLASSFDDMAARLQTLVQAQGELWANVSHEFRTPLARIRVALALCEEEPQDPEALREQLRGVESEIIELDGLVEEVLSLARLERRARLPLRREACDLDELLADAAKRSQQRYAGRELTLQPTNARLDGDPVLLRRLFENLFDNAFKYGGTEREAARVELTVRQREPEAAAGGASSRGGAQLLIQLQDNGPGVAEDELEQVFEPFFRARSSAAKASGSGLGLALCRRIVEAHDGKIRVVNGASGGLCVQLQLPQA